jgi:MFS family permease
LRLNLKNIDDRNAWFLVLEIFWAGIIAAAATFTGAYALRLGATNVQIGLLSSLPGLLAVFVSIPAGHFLETRRDRKSWMVGALTIYRTGFALIAVIPWLHIPDLWRGPIVVAILILMNIPLHFFNIGWIPFLAEAVPETKRASVFSARNVIANITLSLSAILYGLWLNQRSFPINYQLMFLSGYIAGLLSSYFVTWVRATQPPSIIPDGQTGRPFQSEWRTLQHAFANEPAFIRITINTIFHAIGLWTITPIYILYFVRQLNASDTWIGLQATFTSVGTIIGYLFWRYVISRRGEIWTLKRTIIFLGIYPVLIGLFPFLNIILLVVGLNGFLAGGVNLSHFTTLLKMMPASQRPTYTALYVAIVNIGAFVCPLIGVWLADLVGFRPILIGCGILSIIGSLSFWIWPVRARVSI